MKLKYIDVLRGLAILGVLIVHCVQNENYSFFPDVFTSAVRNGARGVQLFFIASAFTLFLSMEKRFEHEKHPILYFFIRRFFRIAPMYYIGICYYLWQDGFGDRYFLCDPHYITIGNILSNVFFVHGFNPNWITSLVPGGWSIAIEMLFYCFVPFLFVKIKNSRQAYNFVLITLAINFLSRFIFHKFQLISCDRLWSDYLFIYLPNQLPVFALGILFYFIVKEDYKIMISPKLILLTSVILLAQFIDIFILPSHFLFGIAFVLMGIAMSKYEFRALENPVLRYIGKISYSMYLVHFAVLYWLTKIHFIDYIAVTNAPTSMLNYGIRLVLLIVISVLISSVFYKLVEVPMQHVGKKLIDRIDRK